MGPEMWREETDCLMRVYLFFNVYSGEAEANWKKKTVDFLISLELQ